ncbi:MAG: ATP-binding protein [Clostridia bacterium]|nr:ATP-binding protein [Clostridia bacterium]
MLVASMNPCPCGNYGSRQQECVCTANQIQRYRAKISGPLLDRIDLQLVVDSVKYEELTEKADGEPSASIKQRVDACRAIQRNRLQKDGIFTNSEMGEKQIKKYCVLSPECEAVMQNAFKTLNLSARARSRILKVARTIADLAGEEDISRIHLLEAIGYRTFDQSAR